LYPLVEKKNLQLGRALLFTIFC